MSALTRSDIVYNICPDPPPLPVLNCFPIGPRIDYNIELSASSVEVGLKELHTAEKHQKKNRKMMLIFILTIVIIVLLVILFVLKT